VARRMGKASSAKKIKRVQQAGATRSPGQRRQLGFPALVIGILVVGLVLTGFAIGHRRSIERVAPSVGDEWYMAYGTNICGLFQESYPNVGADGDIFLGADGLINVRPTSEDTEGANALFGSFLQSIGIQVSDTSIVLPDGTTYTNGETCEGLEGEARVALYEWPPQSGENTDPRIITSNIGGTRFTDDGRTYVLAFAPRTEEIPLPPSHDRLENPDTDSARPVSDDPAAGGDTDDTGSGPGGDGDGDGADGEN